MPIKRPSHLTDRLDSLTVPSRPISSAEIGFLQRAVSAIAPDWSVELQVPDEATVVVLPEDGDDKLGPTFIISQDGCNLRLAQVHWDVLSEIGLFASMKDVVRVLGGRLGFGVAEAAPASVTLH